jgi:D-alanyl-D-alanine dipeptidase
MKKGRRLRELNAPREPGISRLAKIPIKENGDPLIDLCKEYPELVVTACPTYIRKTVADMLEKARASLPEGMRLKVHTALRTLEMQTNGYWNHYKNLQEKHPVWPEAILRREANKFWHPPDVPKAPPGHCTGGAADVGLIDSNGDAIDVTSVTKKGATSQPTFALYLTPEAKRNRAILIKAMTDAGFSNCYDEWWHWSYGDCGWAARLGFPEAIYGFLTEYPEEVYQQVEERKRQREEEERRKKEEEAAKSEGE